MRLNAVGHRLLVKPIKIEEKTEGGLWKPQQVVAQEQGGVDKGTVVDIGPDCWVGADYNSKWCEVGDEIVWPRYAGKPITTDDGDLMVINDADVLAKVIG